MEKYIEKMIVDMELRGMTASTQEPYIRRVLQFFKDTNADVNEIAISDIRSYIIELKYVKKLSIGTINAYISALKFFYTIALGKEWDARQVPRLKGYQTFPVIMCQDEVFKIFDEVTNLKHKAILMLMYGSGLRVNEVVRLKVSDIDSQNMQVRVNRGKNRSDRYAILSQKSLLVLREYWKHCGKPRDWLFPGSNEGEHLHVKSVKNLVIRIRERLKINKKISSHSFRHCFATHLLENKVELPYIQQLLGHKSIKSTMRYLHMTSKAKMNIKSPLDQYQEDGIS